MQYMVGAGRHRDQPRIQHEEELKEVPCHPLLAMSLQTSQECENARGAFTGFCRIANGLWTGVAKELCTSAVAVKKFRGAGAIWPKSGYESPVCS